MRVKLVPPGLEGLNGCASNQPRMPWGEQKPLVLSPRDRLGPPPGSPSGSDRNLRGGPRCVFARHPKLCAHCSRHPPAFRRVARRQVPRAAAPQPPLPSFGPQTFPRCLQFPPWGLPRGCGSRACALRWPGSADAAFQMTTSSGPGSAHGTDWAPGAPTPSLPRRGGERNTFSYLPAAEDHTLRSALSTHPLAAGEDEKLGFCSLGLAGPCGARARGS